MVLGHPERVVPALIHALGVLDDLVQRAAQFRLRTAALVDRGAGVPEILHVDRAVIGAIKFRDHRLPSQMPASRYIRPGCGARAASGHAAAAPPSVTINSRRPDVNCHVTLPWGSCNWRGRYHTHPDVLRCGTSNRPGSAWGLVSRASPVQ